MEGKLRRLVRLGKTFPRVIRFRDCDSAYLDFVR